ncbi:MAG: carboxypeptidase-like regulatory domain-containing protein [Thermoanaerobaculia bacterium]
MKRLGRVLLPAVVALGLACASPPPPTSAALRLAGNARARVEGRVVDRGGRPVAGISVLAIPRGPDIEWSPSTTTDSDGRFVLMLLAPADYAFLLSRDGRSVITPDAEDPVRVIVSVRPGERRSELELHFLGEVPR